MAARTRRRRRGRSASGRFVKGGGRSKRRRARSASPRRRRRRSTARAAAPRRRRRRAAARRSSPRRRRSSRRAGLHRPRVYRRRGRYFSKGMLHGVRVNPRRRRRSYSRRRGYRSNPFSMPTMGSVTGVLKTGAAVTVGWVGVNAVLMIADKVGLAKIKAAQSPTVGALINAAVRTLATPVVAKLAARFLKLDASKVAAGGAINVVLHGVQDLIAANPTVLPDAAKPLLLGYDGFGDFVSISDIGRAGVSGYADMRNIAAARGMHGFGEAVNGRVAGRVFA